MIEFITPKMYGLDDTLTKPGFGADAKAVGDALAALEDKAGIPYAPTVNIWELDEGIYRIAGGFQWGQYEPPTNPRYTYITSGLLIVSVETRINDARVYTVIADNKIYYGKSTPFEVINADTGKKEIRVDGTIDYIEKVEKIDDMTTAKFGVPSSGAVKKYIDSFGLKTLTLGNLQKAYIQNLETGIYCVSVEEGGRAGIYAGKSAHHVMDTAYLIVGGSNYTEETADKDGVTRYNKSYILINGVTNQAFYYAGLIDSEKLDGVWTHTKVGGDVIETKDNKAFAIDETIRDHTKYVSALAVKEYVDAAGAGSGISEVPSNYIWELESGVYHISQPIFYSQNLEGEQELIFCKDGYIVIAIDDFTHRRSFRLFANDGKVYYGYSEPHLINTDNGTKTIVYSELETLDPCAITVIEGDADVCNMAPGTYLVKGNFHYQSDTTDIGGEEPDLWIETTNALITIEDVDYEDMLGRYFTIITGKEIYKGYSAIQDLTADGLGIFATTGVITATLNVVENFSDVEEDAEYSAIASVHSVKQYLNKENYMTRDDVLALIPASAEEVEY